MRRYLIVAAAAAVALGLSVGSASAAPAPKAYKNCTALNKVYPNGVAKTKTAAAKAVKNGAKRPAVSKKVYLLNEKSDRDGDLVACESAARTQTSAPETAEPTIALTPTGVPEVDAMMQAEANAGALTQNQATLLYVATGAMLKQSASTCPLWPVEQFRIGVLNTAATPKVLAAYDLGVEQLPWLRSQLEQITTMVCRYAGYAV